jgi:putative ABC transport system permease protein
VEHWRPLAPPSRSRLRRPVTAAGIVLVLAIGLGVSIAMFSVLHGIVFRALPYPGGDRIVLIHAENVERGRGPSGLTAVEAAEMLTELPGFEHVAYYQTVPGITVTTDDGPVRVESVWVSPDYFAVFGMPAAVGRTLSPADAAAGTPVTVLNHAAWLAVTGGDEAAIGRPFSAEPSPELIGVLPPEFSHPSRAPRFFMVARPPQPAEFNASTRNRVALGRLAPGTSPAAANEALRTRHAAVLETHGLADDGWQLSHVRLVDQLVGNVRNVLLALFALTVLVLLIACATAACLAAIRLDDRRAEFALRQALGASNEHLATNVLLELAVLGALALGSGIVVAHLVLHTLLPLAADQLPRMDDTGLSIATLLFASGAAVVSLLLSALLPLSRLVKTDPARALRSSGTNTGEAGHHRSWLPASSIALSAGALVTALALAGSLTRLSGVEPGFRTDRIVAVSLIREQPIHGFLDAAFEELRALPGVRGVTAALFAAPTADVVLRGEVAVPGGETIPVSIQAAAAGYHRLLGIPLLRGRDIEERDSADAPQVAVINEALARQVFADADPIGRRLTLPGAQPRQLEVVGIAANTRNAGLRGSPEPELVMSMKQRGGPAATLLIEWDSLPADWRRQVHEAIWRARPAQAITRSFTLAEDLDLQLRPLRFFASATAWFALFALALGAAGVSAVIAAAQRRRVREIGLRMALGARPASVAGLMLYAAARDVAIGLAAGFVIAVPILLLVREELFGMRPVTWWSLIGATAMVLTTVGLAAAAWPSWRASRVSPMTVLRGD